MEGSSSVEVVCEDVMVVRNALSLSRQQDIVSVVQQLFSDTLPTPYRYGFDKLGLITLDRCGSHAAHLFADCEAVVASVGASACCPACPVPFAPHLAEVLAYGPGSQLTPHVDCVSGWTVLLAFGATANFFCRLGKDPASPVHRFAFRSGDALCFPTSHERYVWHGISGLDADAPDWFSLPPYARVALQFRQTAKHLY